jgi:hypothetical protein
MRFFGSMLSRRHHHAWRDVERTYQSKAHYQGLAGVLAWCEVTQWILQWCESCGHYRQIRIKGDSRLGPPPLRTPVSSVFLEEDGR